MADLTQFSTVRVGNFSFSPGLVPTLATLAVLPLLVTLGLWQLGRAAEKRDLQSLYELRASSAPLQLDANHWSGIRAGAMSGELAYRRVEMRGRFDGVRQYLLDNRIRHGKAGFEVLTAFKPDGAGGGVMVNRGWIPLGQSRSGIQNPATPETALRITGRIDVDRKPLPLLGETGYEQRDWPKIVQLIDSQKMADGVGYPLLPVVVLLDDDAPAGFAREWKPYYGIPVSRHQGYAVQWFALAAALIVIYIAVNTRRIEDE